MNYTSEMRLLQETQEKLDDLLDKNRLIGRFNCDTYPIVLSISQNVAPEEQMALFEVAQDGVSARDARLRLIFKDGDILIRTDSLLIISDDLMNKIKAYAKKMYYLYLQAFHHGLCLSDPRMGHTTDDEEPEE